MKKISIYQLLLLFTIVCFGAMTSCSNDTYSEDQTIDNKTLQDVRINLTGIKGSSKLRSTIVSLEDAGIKKLHYIVFKSTGEFFSERVLESDFSKIEDKLPVGKYRVVLVASAYKEKSFYEIAKFEYSKAGIIHIDDLSKDIEFFTTELDLDIQKNNVITEAILQRITAKLEIVPTDVNNAPANLTSIQFYFEGTGSEIYNRGQFFFFSGKKAVWYNGDADPKNLSVRNDQEVYQNQITLDKEQLAKISETNPVTFYSLAVESQNGSYPIYARMKYTDKETKTAIVKKDYVLKPNQTLRLTGDLFNNENSTVETGNISVNLDWSSTPVIEW